MAARSGVPRLAPLPPNARNRNRVKTRRARTRDRRMGNRSDLATGRGGENQAMGNPQGATYPQTLGTSWIPIPDHRTTPELIGPENKEDHTRMGAWYVK